jgi:hypothetical protein
MGKAFGRSDERHKSDVVTRSQPQLRARTIYWVRKRTSRFEAALLQFVRRPLTPLLGTLVRIVVLTGRPNSNPWRLVSTAQDVDTGY